MNKRPCLLVAMVCAWATIVQAEEVPFYQQSGYTLEILTEASRIRALALLRANTAFRQMRGPEKTCETIYHLADSMGQSVGYASMCDTEHKYKTAFFCWDASGKHIGHATKAYGADRSWIGDSILHGCGGVMVPDRTYGVDSAEVDTTEPGEAWPIQQLGSGKRRPVLTMLDYHIKHLGLDMPLYYCDRIRYISLGWDKNTYYGAICEIDKTGQEAWMCFDNIVGHFAFFTRYQDNSEWVKSTIYRHCWDFLDAPRP